MSKVPKIFHQIWYQGEANIPLHLQEYRLSWIDKHKHYQFVLWNQHKIESLINSTNETIKKLYYSYDLMIQRIDFAKYIILYFYGGIYIDMDVKCLSSIDTIFETHHDKNVILSYSPTNFAHSLSLNVIGLRLNEKLINNGIMACTPKHALLENIIIQAMTNRNTVFRKLGKNFLHIFYTTGPVMVTQAYRNTVDKHDIVILDNSYFEACNIYNVKESCNPPNHAIALHVYEGSWQTSSEKQIVNVYFFLQKYVKVLLFIILVLILVKYYTKKRKSL